MKPIVRRPLMKAFGSKWTGCRYYPPPQYPLIVEPFALSACYSLWYADRDVILCDIDPEPIAIWNWMLRATAAQVLALPVDLPQGFDLRTLPYDRAACDLIRRWQRIGHCSSWTVSSWNQRPGMWAADIRAHIAAALPQIRHWTALNGSYEDLPVEAIGPATWFVDPPYWVAPGQPKRGGYRFEHIDYDHLARWCRSLPGQVIVCEQEGATWLPFRPSHDITGIKRRVHHKHANGGQEMIWTKD